MLLPTLLEVNAFQSQRSADDEAQGLIQPQRANRRAPHGCQSFDALRLPDKMFRAPITAWMKQADDFTCRRINAGHVRAFEVVTVEAGVGEILRDGRAVVKLRHNVIELERRADERLGQQAILASEPGALPDEFLERRVH